MSFFDDISHAIGTDGSGGGALVELGKPLGFADSSSGLLNNPGVKEAAAVAALVYGVPAGIEYFGFGSAGAAGAGAVGSNGLLALETVAPLGSSTVASVTSGGFSFGGLAQGAMSALNTGSKVIGGLNAVKSLTGGSAASARSGTAVQPIYVNGGGSAGTLVYPSDAAAAGAKDASSAASAASAPVKAKDSTLTALASALTIAAIVFGFMKKG